MQILREFSTDPILSIYVIDDVWEYMKAMKVSYNFPRIWDGENAVLGGRFLLMLRGIGFECLNRVCSKFSRFFHVFEESLEVISSIHIQICI